MDQPAFFLHIPRTAGTTLNAVLRDNYAPGAVLSVYSKEEYTRHAAHSPDELRHIRLIQGHLLLPSYDPPSIYGLPVRVFTFLREPVSRLVSEYHFLRTWKANHMYAWLREHKISFRHYLQGEESLLRYRGRNFMTRCISGMDVGTAPLPMRALARAKRHLEQTFGCVGVQERFLESLLLLGDFLGLRTLLHEKRNALTEKAREPVDVEDLALAQELNQADTALYAFACELLEARMAEQADFARRLQELTFLNANYQKMCGVLLNDAMQEQKNADGLIQFSKDGLW